MYAHCIFCHAPLGENRSIEVFPVGKRLAFDERLGRLWVVCRRCARWNLSPLEERWEAIDECERRFRTAVRRVSTDHVGLAVLPEGLELVRIGQPQRPELAAWRYGRQLMKRRRDYHIHSLPGYALMGGSILALPFVGLMLAPYAMYQLMMQQRVVLQTADEDGRPLELRAKDANSLRLLEDGAEGWRVEVIRGGRSVRGTGAEGLHIAGRMLPHMNAAGAGKAMVESAVQHIENDGTGEDFFRAAARKLAHPKNRSSLPQPGLKYAPEPLKLALEMAVHEDAEHRAMQGELATLEAAWREAEEIAGIADQLLLPRRVIEKMRQLRGTA